VSRKCACILSWLCVLAQVSLTRVALGQGGVVGTRPTQGKISFQAVEDFQINSSKKIKLLPETKGAVDPNTVKRLQKVEISQAGLIRMDGSHLIHLGGTGSTREIVLPENFALKSPTNIADVPGRLALTLVHSKKGKQSEVLAPELFFVFVTGATPDSAVEELVEHDWAFTSLDEQLAAMRGFVASFPGTPAVDDFRASLEQKLASGLTAFEDGRPYKDLLLLRRFAELGREAFPKDPALLSLHDRVVSRIDFVESKLKLLRSLALLGDWDTLLDQYQDFERYEWSFDDIVALREEALEESARLHSRRAQAFSLREDHETAAKEAGIAQARDPGNREIGKLLDAEKVRASQLEARRTSVSRTALAKDSPEEIRFQQSLIFADHAIDDKSFTKAEDSLRDAARENPDAPEIKLGRARLLAARGQLAEALPLLDSYDRMVVDSADRLKGTKVRSDILYELDKKRETYRKDIETLTKSGEYSKLNDELKAALEMDSTDPDFLFNGGLVAAVVRDTNRAKDLLARYLDRSNALDGDLKLRDRAVRIRSILNESKPLTAQVGVANWLSGRKLAEGTYYCPESLAFQIPIDSVQGDKVHMNFTWDKGHLESISTTFEDPKGFKTYHTLKAPGAPEETAASYSEDLGKFFFQYPKGPGALLIAREGTPFKPGPPRDFRVHVVRNDEGIFRMVTEDNETEIALSGNPSVDLNVMTKLVGSVGTTIAGNSVFNPFLWEGLHYFTVHYDSEGRAESAQEWGADNMVRFRWDGLRLISIRAFKKGEDKAYYQRTMTYSGSVLSNEDFTLNGRSGHIRYIYGNDKSLQQIKIENEGKDWIARPRT